MADRRNVPGAIVGIYKFEKPPVGPRSFRHCVVLTDTAAAQPGKCTPRGISAPKPTLLMSDIAMRQRNWFSWTKIRRMNFSRECFTWIAGLVEYVVTHPTTRVDQSFMITG